MIFLILRLYKEKVFDFDETKDVFNLIVSLLKKAIKRGVNVKAERIQFDSEVLAKCGTSFLLRKTYLKKQTIPIDYKDC